MNDKKFLFLNLWRTLALYLPSPVEEYRFFQWRRWRFDFAWPEHMVAVEIEGNAWRTRGGGRHMQDSDLEKYNTATALGWRVFRFSPKMLKNTPYECVEIVKRTLKGE